MVICKFFQNGNCRFGSKCNNEHFNVKETLKSDVESALQGHQWPLSCFGPFKEKPCIPNFIEDQSFEEVRYMCYEAKKQNCFPSYQQQFTQQVLDSQNKMRALLTLSKEVLDGITHLHDSSELGERNQTQNSNPFAMGTTNHPGSGLFGNASSSNSNPFSKGSALNSASVSTLGAQSQQTPSGAGIFGSQSSFGGGSFGAQTQPSIFGQQAQVQQTSIFSLGQLGSSATITPAMSGNIFGAGAQQPQQQSSLFGSCGTFASSQPSTNIFDSNNQNQMSQAGNIFAQAMQQQTIVASAQPAFEAIQQPAFGQNTLTHQQTTLFSTPSSGNLFASVPVQTQNSFGASTVSQPQPSQHNVFGQPQSQNTTQNSCLVPETTPSVMAALTSDQIEAFKANTFTLTNIPLVPPPRELCS